jgi:hypothetical protein
MSLVQIKPVFTFMSDAVKFGTLCMNLCINIHRVHKLYAVSSTVITWFNSHFILLGCHILCTFYMIEVPTAVTMKVLSCGM